MWEVSGFARAREGSEAKGRGGRGGAEGRRGGTFPIDEGKGIMGRGIPCTLGEAVGEGRQRIKIHG